jgi:U2-associated protein SR140
LSKVWVKAGTYDAGSRSKYTLILILRSFLKCLVIATEEDHREKGKLYKPTSKLDQPPEVPSDRATEYAKMVAAENKKDTLSLKKKTQEKKKSNLELFKEELRQ